ncbi:hypothetical protein JQ506_22990 [Shinella sp. PSBB067]|uniref:hypothetical protein n=1 Tax=Shinella sp. PSBB067 TaxID=2715959 RepID=UPI00193BD8C5|nr:hypothetical protein [Shinella sp. PSBB067]QRI63628.1 hypothetical protein JQ506_22990 [Shinella sp. PSBB067]
MKSHIIPRALSLDLKRGEKHLVSGRLGQDGIRKLQNGRWSYKILCEMHEKHLGPADKYGVEFVRSIMSRDAKTGDFTIHNSQPHLLKKFILALIWRADAANKAEGLSSRLGPYDQLIRNCIFLGGDLNAPIYFLRPNLTADGTPLPITLEPTRVRMRDCNGWKLGFGNLDVMVKLDKKPWPKAWEAVDASLQTSVLVLDAEPSAIRDAPAYHPLIRQMKVFRA